MLLYIGKVILLYSVSVIVIRLLGKAAFAQLTSHDLTAIIFLATLGVHPLLDERFDRILPESSSSRCFIFYLPVLSCSVG
jgi:uncharacterized membrane protein YcaP (DUF421 family)